MSQCNMEIKTRIGAKIKSYLCKNICSLMPTWSLTEGFIMCLVVPVEHFRLNRLKRDLRTKTFVHPASLI